jgi:hypothetical protein
MKGRNLVNEKLKLSIRASSSNDGIEVTEDIECTATIHQERNTTLYNSSGNELIEDNDDDRSSKLYSQCKDAQLEVCINVVGIVFDLYGIPASVATKGSNNLVKAMNQESKDKLSSITTLYFSNPSNIIHIAKGLKLISDLILDYFGDISSVMKAAFKDALSKVDYMIIATCISLNISLLFVTGGAELIISLTLISKTIYDVSSSVMKMTMLEQEYDSLVASVELSKNLSRGPS